MITWIFKSIGSGIYGIYTCAQVGVIQYGSTVYIYIEIIEVRNFFPTPKPVNIFFVTSIQCRLGIANLKNVFRSHFKNLLRNFKKFLFSQIFYWLTDWLTDWLFPLLIPWDKCNSITAIATALISSLFNVASSRGVPFHQPQLQLQCLHDGSTKAYLYSPLYSIPFFLTT